MMVVYSCANVGLEKTFAHDRNGKVPPSPFLTRSEEERQELRKEREKRAEIVLWRKPLMTLSYFLHELSIEVRHQSSK